VVFVNLPDGVWAANCRLSSDQLSAAGVGPVAAQGARVDIFYSPDTNLEEVDVATLNAINMLAWLGRSGSRVRCISILASWSSYDGGVCPSIDEAG
jgi:hypothetical protein